jgi:outer membrane protein TolC
LDTSLLAAQLLTPLDFTINKGQLGTFPGTGPIPGSNTDLHTPARPVALAAVTLTQPLIQLLRVHLSVAEQRLRVDSTQLSFDQAEQKLVDDVRRAYYAVLQTQSQLESQQSMLMYLEELQQLTDRRFHQQAVLEADRPRVRSELYQNRYQLAVARMRLRIAKSLSTTY